MEKLKIPIPLIELVNKTTYRSQVMKALSIGQDTDTINVSDDQLEILFGLEVDGKLQDGDIPHFYVSLNIHYEMLHNAMNDSRASHNLILSVIMETLGLDITR